MKTWHSKIPLWGLAALLLLLAGLYFYLLKPDVAGFLYDDGMYLMAAKALASGQGYRLTDIAGSPWFYKYPPLYPVCLAAIWLVNSDFPGNIIWLKSFNILLVLLSLGLLFYYFRRCLSLSPWLSLGIIMLLGTNWHLIEVTIEMMSEPLFLFLSLLTLMTVHPVSGAISQRRLCLLILLSVAAFYTRTMGLTIILATAAWLALKGNRKQTIIYITSCLAAVTPWFAWSLTKPNTTQPLGDFLVRSFQESYFESLWMDLKYEYTLPEIIWGGIRELLGNASIQFFPLLERLQIGKPVVISEVMILTLSFAIVLSLGWHAYRCWQQKQLTLSAMYVGIYLAVLPFWSFYQCYPRFLIIILPFLWAWLILALQQHILSPKFRNLAIGAVILAGLISNALHLQAYLYKPYPNTMSIDSKTDLWSNYQGVITFLNVYAPKDAVIYTDNVDETYLYALNTNRKAFDRFLFLPKSKVNQACPTNQETCLLHLYEKNAEAMLHLLVENHVSYLIVNQKQITKMPSKSWHLISKTAPTSFMLLARYPNLFLPVAQTADGWITVFQIHPNVLRVKNPRAFNKHGAPLLKDQ